MGQKPDKILDDKIKNLISRITDIDVHFHHLHIHEYGNNTEITFHIMLPPHISLADAHKITERIESAIKKEMNFEATIHMEPFE